MKTETRTPKPKTRNPEPRTQNPKPKTRNPKSTATGSLAADAREERHPNESWYLGRLESILEDSGAAGGSTSFDRSSNGSSSLVAGRQLGATRPISSGKEPPAAAAPAIMKLFREMYSVVGLQGSRLRVQGQGF